MTELDNNVFIKEWHCLIDNSFKKYYIYYIDGSKHVITFTVESTKGLIKRNVLHFVEKKLKEKGWIKEEPEYDPSKDPYYKQEWLYVNAKIN